MSDVTTEPTEVELALARTMGGDWLNALTSARRLLDNPAIRIEVSSSPPDGVAPDGSPTWQGEPHPPPADSPVAFDPASVVPAPYTDLHTTIMDSLAALGVTDVTGARPYHRAAGVLESLRLAYPNGTAAVWFTDPDGARRVHLALPQP